MADVSAGQLLINDRQSTELGNRQRRKALATIPQDPYFHPGTVRENLDPERLLATSDIEARLGKVGLLGKVTESGGLDAALQLDFFSTGQLQLLSLARVMMHPKGIVLFDEATSK